MRTLVERFAPDLLGRCLQLVGEDPFARVTESTRFAQPAIFCASVASLIAHEQAAGAGGPGTPSRPIAYAGHSLGELAALLAGGALRREDALELAVRRGALMAQAGEGQDGGGMLALIGASDEQCRRLAELGGVVIANENAPGQTVLAGPVPSLRELRGPAREEGLRAILLDVAGAFHSPAMAPAVQPFRELLDRVEVYEPHTPVISCASAQPFVDVRGELADAIVRPVRWSATMSALAQMGATAYLDYGPGNVLGKLVSRNVEGAQALQPLRPSDQAEGAGAQAGPAAGGVHVEGSVRAA